VILFRCWYCGKRYARPEEQVGVKFVCTCKQRLRVPKRSGGNARWRTLGDVLIEFAVYGTGGGILGFLLGVVIVSRLYFVRQRWLLVVGLTLAGFLAGGFGGEAGVNWIGRMIREREQR
jgi:hypothetical protein